MQDQWNVPMGGTRWKAHRIINKERGGWHGAGVGSGPELWRASLLKGNSTFSKLPPGTPLLFHELSCARPAVCLRRTTISAAICSNIYQKHKWQSCRLWRGQTWASVTSRNTSGPLKEQQHKSIISLEDPIQDSHVGKLRSGWKTTAPHSLVVKECLWSCLKPKIIRRALHGFQMWEADHRCTQARGRPPPQSYGEELCLKTKQNKKRYSNELVAKWRKSAIPNQCEHSCERGCGTGKAQTGWACCWPRGSLLLPVPRCSYL